MQNIESTTNQTIKDLYKLHSKRYRDEHKLFIVEGYKLIEAALIAELEPEFIIFKDEELYKNLKRSLLAVDEKLVISHFGKLVNVLDDFAIFANEACLKKVSSTSSPAPIVASFYKPEDFELAESKLASYNQIVNQTSLGKIRECRLDLYLDEISNPGNLGAILRSAALCEIENVYLSPNCADLYNAKVLRSSLGAHFVLNIYELEKSLLNESKQNSLDELKFKNYQTIASSPRAKHCIRSLQTQLEKDKNYLLMIGSEAKGLSEEQIVNSDLAFYLPSSAKLESYNALAASSIAMFNL